MLTQTPRSTSQKSCRLFSQLFCITTLSILLFYSLPVFSLTVWTDPVALPVSQQGATARTTVGTTMVEDSTGRIIAFYLELSTDSRSGQLYFNYYDPAKNTWLPQVFTPTQGRGVNGFNIAIDSADRVHIVWVDQKTGRLKYSVANSDSLSWSPSIFVSAEETLPAEFPAISVDGKNRVHVAWHQVPSGDTEAEIFYSCLEEGAKSWTVQVNLSETLGQSSVFARGDFSVTDGQHLAYAWRENNGGSSSWDLMAAISDDGGKSWYTRVIAGGAGQQRDPALTVMPDGDLLISYEEWPETRGTSASSIKRILFGVMSAKSSAQMQVQPISPDDIVSELVITCTDRVTLTHWVCWKDERNRVSDTDVNAEIVCRATSDRGASWEELEFATHLNGEELGYKKCAVGVDGALNITYETPPTGETRIYHHRRVQNVAPKNEVYVTEPAIPVKNSVPVTVYDEADGNTDMDGADEDAESSDTVMADATPTDPGEDDDTDDDVTGDEATDEAKFENSADNNDDLTEPDLAAVTSVELSTDVDISAPALAQDNGLIMGGCNLSLH